MTTNERTRPATSFRLAGITNSQIDTLAEMLDINKTSVITLAVDRCYSEETANTNYIVVSREKENGSININTVGEYGTMERAQTELMDYYSTHDPVPLIIGIVAMHDRQPRRVWVYQGLGNWLAEMPIIRSPTGKFKPHPLLAD